ncbi:hypothetical protein BDN72DRAFT_307822 [Pluteus cervinus]|uniref:Uncharacterized protein n=1 Tax=Pluteus cervinus TaxID=181527 RepID=A0ACD3ACN6_9AGAR|nr:hypothetical protein BDN72DRAFT_307822 [Pluteus cervinus]
MDYDSYDAVLHWVFRSTHGEAWFKPSEENISAGVCLRVAPGDFRIFPYENPYLAPFEAAVRLLNPLIAVKVRSAAVHSALATVADDATAIYVDINTRIQILPDVTHLPKADKEQCAAFLRDERVMIVWSDDLDHIVPLCSDFDNKLMNLIWRVRPTPTNSSIVNSVISSGGDSGAGSAMASNVNLNEKQEVEQPAATVQAAADALKKTEKEQKAKGKRKCWGWMSDKNSAAASTSDSDPEKGVDPRKARPIRLFAPLYNGLGLGLAIFFIVSGINMLLQESRLDPNYMRFALIGSTPFLLCVAMFFSLQIIIDLSFVIGPVAQYHENSRYYSAIPPEPNPEVDAQLPHVTIEMPVYKESLEETIAPSVYSLKKAMQTYARQGGSSAIFIHDDGLQSLKEEERQKRIEFYADHNIGWVARPPHSDKPDGFFRAGRFKKASNMNYGLQLSLLMEKHILALEASGEPNPEGDFGCLEDRALEMALDEMYKNTGNKWRPWASNARSLRVGDVILLVDSDTIIPEDCLRDAARELAECPEVAIIQHESDVLQVAKHYFENGIAHFTRRINKAISMGCANGEIAPFVGHNAFLRWSAVQEVSVLGEDGVGRIWSEDNVSEDFDMALRLQLKGYIIRWANYSRGGFKEGVSLTVDDELNRWQKYSYGCNELIFNPLHTWWRLGPINKQLRTFVWSNAPIHYKISMMSYMFSYYGIAASGMMSVINYVLLGIGFEPDGFYMHSFEIFLACTVVFPGAGNVSFTILEHRLGIRDIAASFIENFTWVPFFFFFFNGLSIHLSTALLAHLFSYNITWGATKKEVERSNFWEEVPKILKRYWFAWGICFVLIAGMIIFATPLVPAGYQIPGSSWSVILPLALVTGGHILFPIVLNPWLMIFSY